MAQMLEELHPQPGHRVLEIGTGTGYNAALLSMLVGPRGRVTSIELDPDLAKKARRALRSAGQPATIVVGDGRGGWEKGAPYDRIVVTASSLEVPRAFHEQLVEDGLLVVPLRLTDPFPFRQVVVAFKRAGRGLRSVAVIHGGFMRLRRRPEDPSIPWPISKVVHEREDPTRPWSPLGAARGAGSPRNSVNVPSRCYFSRIVPGPSASERQGGVSGSSRPSSAWRCPKRSWWDAHAPTWTASCTSERRSLASPTPCGAESPTLGEARRYPASRDTAIRERNGSSRTPCVVGAGAVNLESPAWRSTSHSPVRHRRRGGRRNADPAFSRSTIGSRGHPAAHPWNRGSLSERPLPVSSSHGGLRTADKA